MVQIAMKAYFARLTISHKLLISSLAFYLPITVLFYFMISGINSDIRCSRMELWGTRLLRPLEALVELVPEHRRLAYFYLDGNTALKNELDLVASRIDDCFDRLLAESGKTGLQLQIDEDALDGAGLVYLFPPTIRQQWKLLRDRTETMAPEGCSRRHRKLLADIRALMRRVGETSLLILDTDLDSHYMVDVVLLTMPQMHDRLGEVLFFGHQVLAWGELIQQDRLMFAAYASKFKESDRNRILNSIATARREDRFFQGENAALQSKLPPLVTVFVSASQSFARTMHNISSGSGEPVSVEEFVRLGAQARRAGSDLHDMASDILEQLLQKRISNYEARRRNALVLSLCALVLAAGLGLLISRGITVPLGHITAIAAEIAKGNVYTARQRLQQNFPEAARPERTSPSGIKDETWLLFQAMSRMACNLYSLLDQVRSSGNQVTAAADLIASSVIQLEGTVAGQASATIQTSTTGKQISQTSHELADTMTVVTKKAAEAAALAGSGRTGLDQLQTTMEVLLAATEKISGKLTAIDEKAVDINQVITTITKLADQTNLLSLNAAIEADKAGEHGLGFSVVAQEIRRLADQTAVATMDIEQIVREMGSAVTDGVDAMDGFTLQVRQSSQKTTAIGADLSTVIEQARDLGQQFESVNQSMHMQSSGADQISQAMQQLNDAARQTEDSLFDFKRVTDQLKSAVRSMQSEVSHFRLDG